MGVSRINKLGREDCETPCEALECCDCCASLAAAFADKCLQITFSDLTNGEAKDGDCECCEDLNEVSFKLPLFTYSQHNEVDGVSYCKCRVVSYPHYSFIFPQGANIQLPTDCEFDVDGCGPNLYTAFSLTFCDPEVTQPEPSNLHNEVSLALTGYFGEPDPGSSFDMQGAIWGHNTLFSDELYDEAASDAANAVAVTLAAGDPVELPLKYPETQAGGVFDYCLYEGATVTIQLVPVSEDCPPPENPEPPEEFTCEEFQEDCIESGDITNAILECQIEGAVDRSEPTIGVGCGTSGTFHFTLSELNSSFTAEYVSAATANAETGGDCSIVEDVFRYRWGTVGDYDNPGKRIAWIEYTDPAGWQWEMYATGIYIQLVCEENLAGQDGVKIYRVDIPVQVFTRSNSDPMVDADFQGTACMNDIFVDSGRSFTLAPHCIAPEIFANCLINDTETTCDPNPGTDEFLLRVNLGPEPGEDELDNGILYLRCQDDAATQVVEDTSASLTDASFSIGNSEDYSVSDGGSEKAFDGAAMQSVGGGPDLILLPTEYTYTPTDSVTVRIRAKRNNTAADHYITYDSSVVSHIKFKSGTDDIEVIDQTGSVGSLDTGVDTTDGMHDYEVIFNADGTVDLTVDATPVGTIGTRVDNFAMAYLSPDFDGIFRNFNIEE